MCLPTGTAKTYFTVISKTTPTPSTKPTEPPATTSTPMSTKRPATLVPTSTKEPTGTTGSPSTEKTVEKVTAATATPVVKTIPSAVKSDAGATKTTSVIARETTEPQPTESLERTVSDSKEPEQQDTCDIVIGRKQEDAQTVAESDEQEENGEEDTDWIIGVIALCGVVIAGAIAWILWRKTKDIKR